MHIGLWTEDFYANMQILHTLRKRYIEEYIVIMNIFLNKLRLLR